ATPNVNAGTYRLEVTRIGETGTYKLAVSVPPQTFDLTLPASVSFGVPKSGAGYMETNASEDIYRFTMASAGALQLDPSCCASRLGGGVDYKLLPAGGAVVASGTSCSSVALPSVAAGDYRLSISRYGKSGGSYAFKLLAAPPPDVADVTLPASVTGNLET